MLPLVKPVASVISESEVPAYPFLLKIGAVFSMMNCRVRSALLMVLSSFTTQKYTIRYKLQNFSLGTLAYPYIRFKLSHVRSHRPVRSHLYPPHRRRIILLPFTAAASAREKTDLPAAG